MEAHASVPHSLEFKPFVGVKITHAAEQAVEDRVGRVSPRTIRHACAFPWQSVLHKVIQFAENPQMSWHQQTRAWVPKGAFM